jgi:hypothetical protein
MKLDTPIRVLGPVDHAPLKDALQTVPPEAWLEEQVRQQRFEVHRYTQSIILIFAQGWPKIKVSQRQGWQYFAREAEPVVKQIIKAHYPQNGQVIRAMLARLVAGGVIEEHMDEHPSFAIGHRIHVPLITNDDVDFTVRGELFHLAEGVAYEVSNLDFHAVNNRSAVDRVHFIFDYVDA